MKVLAHPDPVALEQELLSRIENEHGPGMAARSLIVTPTSRLAEHVQRRLTARRSAWLGLEVLHLSALAGSVLLDQTGGSPRRCSPRLLQALLQRQLERFPDNPWARFARGRPGTVHGLVGAMRDLREAGIATADLAACRLDGAGRGLLEIYRHYGEALERLSAEGWADDAGIVRAAAAHAKRFAEHYDSILVHGAYELIGVQIELIRALDGCREVTLLLPAGTNAPVSAYSEEFAARFLLAGNGAAEPIDASVTTRGRARLDALYHEECTPEPPVEVRFDFRHAQGAAAEVRIAVREALQAIGDGLPPREIAVVAGTLAPYVPALEEALDDEGLEWTSSATSPLGRQPVARDFMLLLEVLAEDFPRRSTVELLASPRIDWGSLAGGARTPAGDRVDVWSREAQLIGGFGEWVEELPRWAEQTASLESPDDGGRTAPRRRARERCEGIRLIAASLKALHALARPGLPRSWAGHAQSLLVLFEALFVPPVEGPEDDAEPAATEALRDLLTDVARLETVLGERREVPFRELCDRVAEAVRSTVLALRSGDNGGIRVLDAMTARGLTFRRVHLLGMNAGVFPRPPREDPIVPESLRRELRERTARPLALKGRVHLEQRLLLSMTLGSARDRVAVSWQRADESGRASNPSLALREVARVALGRPDLEGLLERARHLPSHPTQSLQEFLERPGLLAPAEERLLAALLGAGPDSTETLAERYPELESGLRMIRATEAFRSRDPSYDARVGPLERSPSLSVSSMQRLGRCPLQHFFQDVLRVRELEAEADVLEVASREWGNRAHELLESIYERLRDEGSFESNTETLRRRAVQLLHERRHRALGELGVRISRRLPVLWDVIARGWVTALEAFVNADLERIVGEAWRPLAFEESCSAELDLGDGVRLVARGRFDRRLDRDGQVLIGDYKTGGIDKLCDVTRMLRGQALQVPLYRLIAGGDAGVELLGVGPAHDPDDPGSRDRFDGFTGEDEEIGFRETLRVLLRLRERGAFPLNEDRHCSWCAYASACRRKHPPTADREESSKDGEDFRSILRKTKSRKPTLARVRAELPADEGAP